MQYCVLLLIACGMRQAVHEVDAVGDSLKDVLPMVAGHIRDILCHRNGECQHIPSANEATRSKG